MKLERHGMNMLIAGPVLWVLGSIHNSCQIYQRADGHIQILQQSVHIPFLMGSLLFLVAAILNVRQHIIGFAYHGLQLLVINFQFLSVEPSLVIKLIIFPNTLYNYYKGFWEYI